MTKYQWPASGLTEKEMEILFRTKQETKESICGLLKKAVHIAYGRKNEAQLKNIKGSPTVQAFSL